MSPHISSAPGSTGNASLAQLEGPIAISPAPACLEAPCSIAHRHLLSRASRGCFCPACTCLHVGFAGAQSSEPGDLEANGPGLAAQALCAQEAEFCQQHPRRLCT